MLFLMMPIGAIRGAAAEDEPYITDIDIEINDKAVALSTSYTGYEVSQALKNAIVSVEGGAYVDQSCTYLVERHTYTGGGYWYEDMVSEDDIISETGIYYYLINLEDKNGFDFDPDNLPTVTIDGGSLSTMDYFVDWYAVDKSSVNVYIRAYVTGDDYVSDVQIYPRSQKIKKGTSYTFSVEVTGSIDQVNWELTGSSTTSTRVTSGGQVIVAANEEADSLGLTARSVYNPGAYCKIYIDVTEENVYIESVTVTPKTATMIPGDRLELTVDVVGTDDHQVTWTITGSSTSGTRITPYDQTRAALDISKEETASSITVRVTSAKDPTKYDEAVITITPLEMIHEVEIEAGLATLQIDTTVTGQQVTSQLKALLDKAQTTGNVYIDTRCSYLVIKNSGAYESLEYGSDTLAEDGEYYILINLEDNSGFVFDRVKLPTVTVDGRTADDVLWYSTDFSSVNVFVRVYLGGAEPQEIPPTYTNVYGSGIKISWNPVEGAVSYDISRASKSSPFQKIAQVTETTFTDKNVTAGEEYAYQVTAYDSSNRVVGRTTAVALITYNPFKDVKTSESYFKHLMWAYNNEVIKGTTATTFNPKGNCKRCDLAVMLYRMYGKPSISGMSNPFSDVKSSDYFYSAVVWASNKGYIKGLSGTNKFNPQGTITRQDMVVILWRINGSKVVDIENPFTDVKEGHYAYKAIMWAYKNKITSGTSATTFAPTANCQRYQLAVFLHKFNDIQHVIS